MKSWTLTEHQSFLTLTFIQDRALGILSGLHDSEANMRFYELNEDSFSTFTFDYQKGAGEEQQKGESKQKKQE